MSVDWTASEFDTRLYRFSVRCDRDFNQRLEQAAKGAGLSVTAFVQRHFEAILDAPADGGGFSPEAFARLHSVTPQAAVLFDTLRRIADEAGVVTGSVAAFAAACGQTERRLNYHFRQLVEAGLVGTIAAARAGRKGTYRILDGQAGEGRAQ